MKIRMLLIMAILLFCATSALAATVGVPASLTVPLADADGAYKVSWGASTTAGVTYQLQEATDSLYATGLRTISAGTALNVNITGRSLNKTYYYRVRATKTGYTASPWRTYGSGCAVPGTTQVSAPASITVPVADADGAYAVSWGASVTAGAIYELQEATVSNFTAGLRTAYRGPARTFSITGRSQNVTYYYRVRAVKAGLKDSGYRAGVVGCAVPGSAQAGAPASILVPVADADGAYTVSWGASATAGVTYELQEATASNFTAGLRTVCRGTARTFNITGRSQNVTYYYRVRAVKAGLKDSGFRAGTSGCALPGTAVAGAPASITAPVADTDGTYTVNWGASATAGVTYELQEATASNFTTGLRTIYRGTGRTANITGRSQNVTYYYRVRAVKAGLKDSGYRAGASGCAVPGAAQATAPAYITVPVSDNNGAYAINWGASATAGVIYELQEATVSNFTTGLRTAYRGTAGTFNIIGRSQNVTYYYRVRAVKAGLKDSGWRGTTNGCRVPVCTDKDGDGYSIEGGLCGAVDCNDTNSSRYPAATEICGDGIDQDCSGTDDVCQVKTLTVDVLGNGRATCATDSNVNCTGNCEYDYLQKRVLTLQATAASGSTFSHWNGCDTASGTTCTVAINSDRNVSPSFTKPAVYQTGAVELNAAAMALLLAQTGTSLTFDPAIKSVVTFVAGNVLYSNVVTAVSPGLLRKVVSISESIDQLKVTTVPAMIEDVVREGTFSSQVVLTPTNTTLLSLADGVTVDEAVSTEFKYTLNEVLLDDDGNLATKDDQLILNGTFSAKITVDSDMDIGLTGLKIFNVTMEADNTANLTATAGGTIAEKELKKTLATYTLAPIPIGPGLFLVPEVALIAKAKASVAAKVSSSVNIDAKVVGGVIFRRESGWAPINSSSWNFAFTPPTAEATVGAKVSVGPELTTLIEGLVGPSIGVLGSLGLKGGVSADLVGGETDYWCSLAAGVSVTAGAKLKISKWTLAEKNFTLLDYEKPLYTCPQQPALDQTAPAPPTNLTRSTLLPTSVSLAWTEATDNVAVAGYDIYRDGVRIETSVTAPWYRAMRLEPARTYCFQVKAFDAEGNRSTASNQVCVTTPAAGAHYAMSGTIHSGSNTGPVLAGATVSIAGIAAISDSAGNFAIGGIPAGTHTFFVAKPGYDTYSNAAYFVGTDHANLNFYLTASSIRSMAKLPDTGQINCYDINGVDIPCVGTGQDGAFSRNPLSLTDLGNGTVRDNVTGLVWQKTDDNIVRTWADSATYCDNLILGGNSNWRLPSCGELTGIVDYSRYAPTINPVFVGSKSFYYWSSTPYYNSTFARGVYFHTGSFGNLGKTGSYYVRCVR